MRTKLKLAILALMTVCGIASAQYTPGGGGYTPPTADTFAALLGKCANGQSPQKAFGKWACINLAVSGAAGSFTTLNVSGTSTLAGVTATSLANSGPLTETGYTNVTGLTGTLNDWAPTGFASFKYFLLTTSGSTTINGIAAGAEGRVITLLVDPANAAGVTVNHENAGSVAGNRIQLLGASAWTMNASGLYALTLRYNATAARWQQISGTSATFNAAMTFAGAPVFTTAFTWSSTNTPTTLASGSTNDWAPSSSFVYRVTPAAGGSTITSLLTGVSAGNGRVATITNIAAADNLTLTNDDGASGTAANRFLLDNAASCVLTPNTSITIRYDGTSSRWRPITPCPNSTWSGYPNATITTADTGTQNDYNPAGLASATILRWTGASPTTLNGIAGGTDGRQLIVCSLSSSTGLTLANEAAGSIAANRILGLTGAAVTLTNGTNACVTLLYDGTSARWRAISAHTATTIANMAFNGTVTVSGAFASGGAVLFTNLLSPTAFTGGTVNDYAPSGGTVASTIRQDVTTADTTVTGLSLSNANGRTVTLSNISTSFKIILQHDDGATSTAANRMLFDNASNCVLPPLHNITLRYDGTSSRWRPIDGCPHSTQAGYPGATITVTDTGTVNDYNPTGLANASFIRVGPSGSPLTINGIAGGSDGRQLYVCNVGGGALGVTLNNENAGSIAANRILGMNGSSVLLTQAVNGNTCATLFYDGSSARWRVVSTNISSYNAMLTLNNTGNKGSITMSGGTGTASVVSGTTCTCSDTTAAAAVKCSQSAGTLTVTGTGTDVITYHCF